MAEIHGPIPDWTCANGHRCAPEEGVCLLCGERPKFEYTTEAGAWVPSGERLRLVKPCDTEGCPACPPESLACKREF